MEELKLKFIKGIKWNYLVNLLLGLSRPVLSILLARILYPEDFGLFSMAIVFINFITLFQDAGLGYALIQKYNEDEHKMANVVFYCSLIL